MLELRILDIKSVVESTSGRGRDSLPFDAFTNAKKASPVRAVVLNVIFMFESTKVLDLLKMGVIDE
jgi:hypothetical protein